MSLPLFDIKRDGARVEHTNRLTKTYNFRNKKSYRDKKKSRNMVKVKEIVPTDTFRLIAKKVNI